MKQAYTIVFTDEYVAESYEEAIVKAKTVIDRLNFSEREMICLNILTEFQHDEDGNRVATFPAENHPTEIEDTNPLLDRFIP